MGNEVSRPAGDLSPQSSGVVPPRSPYTPTGGSSRRAQSFNTRSPSPAPSPALHRRTSSSASLGVDPNSGTPTAGNPKKDRTIQRMDKAIRRRVRGGITYNMKLLIRGAKGTGKTSLFQRLKGEPIPDAHQSTPQLQSATINWSFRQHMEENVKCEVWDVVDRGFVPAEAEDGAEGVSTSSQGAAGGVSATPVEHGGLQSRGSLSAEASAAAAAAAAVMQNGTHSVAIVDASTVDVYHEAHGVIFLLDVTKWDTLEYVKQQLDNVPVHIPTLVLGNFRDQGAQRKIFKEDIQELLYGSSDRPQHSQWRRPMELLYFECSLLNCYGLKSLHQYFGIPFLQLKLATIRQQIRIVEGEFAHLKHDVQATISEQRYAEYVEHIKSTGSDIRTGRRGSGNGSTPPTPTRKGSLQLPSRGDSSHGEENGDTDDDVSVVIKENGAGASPKPAETVTTAATVAGETSRQEQDVVPAQDTEDLPARNSSAVIQSAPQLVFEHKESTPSITDDGAGSSAAKPEDNPISAIGSRGVAAPAATTTSSRPRKASVEEVIQLEDFQVPKARISDLDHFYSEDESDEDGEDVDEDVVVAPVDGAMKTAISGVYHKQLFLDSDSSDSDESEMTRSRRKQKASRKSPARQTASKKAPVVSQASPKPPPPSPSPPSPRPPSSSSRPSQRSRPGSPARPQTSSPAAKDRHAAPHGNAPKQEQGSKEPVALAGAVTPTPPAAPPTSPLASSIRHSSPRNKSDNSVPVVNPEAPIAAVQDDTVMKHESSSEEPELTGTEHALESVSLGDQESMMDCVKQENLNSDGKFTSKEELVDERTAPPSTTVGEIDGAESDGMDETKGTAIADTPVDDIPDEDRINGTCGNARDDPEEASGATERVPVQEANGSHSIDEHEDALGFGASANGLDTFLADDDEDEGNGSPREDVTGNEAEPQVAAMPPSPSRHPVVRVSDSNSDTNDGPIEMSLASLQASLPTPELESSAPSYTDTVLPASMGFQSSSIQQQEEVMGHYHKRNHDEGGDLLSLSALQASLPLPGESAEPLSTSHNAPAYSNGGMESTALELSDLRTTVSSASSHKSTVPEFSTVVPSNDLEAFLNESDSDSEDPPKYAESTTTTSGMRSTRQSRRPMVESSGDEEDDDDRFASYSINKKSRSERRRQQKEELRQLNAALDSADNDPFAPPTAGAADASIGSSDVMEAIRKAQEEALRMLPSASSPADDDADSKRHKHKHKKEHKHKMREGDAGKEKASKKSSRKSGASSRSKKRRPRVEEDLA